MPIGKKIRRKGGSPLRVFLWILPNPYKMPDLEPTGFIILYVHLLVFCFPFNSLTSDVILFSWLIMWLISLVAGLSSLENLELSLRISAIALIQEHLSKILTVLPLSAFWMTMFFFLTFVFEIWRWIHVTRKVLVWV